MRIRTHASQLHKLLLHSERYDPKRQTVPTPDLASVNSSLQSPTIITLPDTAILTLQVVLIQTTLRGKLFITIRPGEEGKKGLRGGGKAKRVTSKPADLLLLRSSSPVSYLHKHLHVASSKVVFTLGLPFPILNNYNAKKSQEKKLPGVLGLRMRCLVTRNIPVFCSGGSQNNKGSSTSI